jgi:hypothetical protein
MSKRRLGLAAGLAVASVAAVAAPLSSALASGTASPAAVVTPLTSAASVSAVVPAGVPAAGPTASAAPSTSAGQTVKSLLSTKVAAAATVAKVTPKPAPKPAPKPPVYKLVRRVLLQLPTTAMVGANVTGFVQVLDDNGQAQSPVANARVLFQRKDGARWTVLSDDVTDENGILPVAFMSQTNMSLRAAYVPAKKGAAAIFSKPLTFTSSTQVTWAARPDMDVAAKTPVTYAFRINSGLVPTAHLEFAKANTPSKWVPSKPVRVAPTGVASASISFPGPGTYLVRGATAKTATNSPGYTSSITVTVN